MTCASRITGTGSSFPLHSISNDQIAHVLEEKGIEINDEWIRERTGIGERRFSNLNNPDEQNSSLGMAASSKALQMAEKMPEDIDQIVYATCSPDTIMPSTGCWLQHKMGAKNAWAMDINASCSGFLYGLSIADQFIRTGHAKTILVVGAEVLNPLINWEDRSSAILFGDGAGAAVVESVPASSNQRILSSHLLSDGNLWKLLHVPAGGTNREVTPERYQKNEHKIQMQGEEVFKVAVDKLSQFAQKAVEANELTMDQIDWYVPHQDNARIIDAVSSRLNIPQKKVLLNIERYGNTSSAAIPTVFDEAVRNQTIQKGDLVLFNALGAGLTFGSLLLRW